MIINTEQQLVGKEGLLEILLPNEADRPTVRWLDAQRKAGLIPYIRLGRLIWFSPPRVLEAMERNTICGRSRRQVAA
jgi:hypothetical protein